MAATSRPKARFTPEMLEARLGAALGGSRSARTRERLHPDSRLVSSVYLSGDVAGGETAARRPRGAFAASRQFSGVGMSARSCRQEGRRGR
jgi:hypothetical protein